MRPRLVAYAEEKLGKCGFAAGNGVFRVQLDVDMQALAGFDVEMPGIRFESGLRDRQIMGSRRHGNQPDLLIQEPAVQGDLGIGRTEIQPKQSIGTALGMG